ncbi:MAG TPA: hypothetical protein VMF35_18420 [Acidimicrobiales bacterium]|nr:hypothetical protein [Acidimicrobiales bacterium]
MKLDLSHLASASAPGAGVAALLGGLPTWAGAAILVATMPWWWLWMRYEQAATFAIEQRGLRQAIRTRHP